MLSFFILVLCRVLVTHMEEFHDQAKDVVSHIPSKHASRMSSKGEVVWYAKLVMMDVVLNVCVCVCVCMGERGVGE